MAKHHLLSQMAAKVKIYDHLLASEALLESLPLLASDALLESLPLLRLQYSKSVQIAGWKPVQFEAWKKVAAREKFEDLPRFLSLYIATPL